MVLVFVISPTLGWFLLVLGVVLVGLVLLLSQPSVLNSMRSTGTQTSAAAVGPGIDLNRLEGPYRASMERALNTRRSIERAVAETADPGLRRALGDATREMEELTQTIYNLALKAQSVQTGLNTSNTMARLSEEIERLNNSINSTNDEFQKGQYHAALDGKLQQMQNYTDTDVALKRWDAQLDNALSTLDTILSQVLRIRSSEMLQQTGATDDVSRSLKEQVDSLKAASDAFDAVYGSTRP